MWGSYLGFILLWSEMVTMKIIDGKTSEMSWDKIQANLYREGKTMVIDQTKQDAAVLGIT